jgi:hypothetical protein
MNAARVEELASETETALGNVTNSTVMTKWKWPFVSDWECNSLISTVIVLLNMCQNVANASLFVGIMIKKIILLWNNGFSFNFMILRMLLAGHSSYSDRTADHISGTMLEGSGIKCFEKYNEYIWSGSKTPNSKNRGQQPCA